MALETANATASDGPARVGRQHYPDELWLNVTCADVKEHGLAQAFYAEVLTRMRRMKQRADSGLYYRGMAQFSTIPGFPLRQFEAAIAAATFAGENEELAEPQTGTALLAKDLPPLHYIIDGLMHEGMMLFGGKSKRGKSWLMVDLAMSIATGQYALRHFDCPTPAPVLYLALEDGERRVKRRLQSINPQVAQLDHLHFLYQFPKLAEGGLDLLIRYIEKYQYRLVVIDVLGKLESSGRNGTKDYLEVYEMFTPLQVLLRTQHVCLAMLTHLRKQDADDVFDQLLGSVAYQGAQDTLWVLERKPNDDDALLHIRDKDDTDMVQAITFDNGHWKWLGEGDAYTLSKEKRLILTTLASRATSDSPDMTIAEIIEACGFHASKGKPVTLRKTLSRMVADDLIHRDSHGKYMATLRGMREGQAEQEEGEGVDF